MIVLDTTTLVALAMDEPAANEVEQIIRTRDAAMSAVNAAEVRDVLMRRHAMPAERVDGLIAELEIRPAALREARRASELRARHYHRSRRPLSLADCFLLATARDDDQIATSDGGIAETAVLERLTVLALPNSRGERPALPS